MASLKYSYKVGEFAEAIFAKNEIIANAATGAITEAGHTAQREGRASIASAGFSKRWQNALRLNVYPPNKASINAAAHIYHKIGYAGVFEEGATISGKPLMWLPIRGTVAYQYKIKPEKFRSRFGKPLYSIRAPGKPPMLGADIGERRKAKRAGKSASFGKGVITPLYIGVPRVEVPKKFGVEVAVKRAAANLGSLYLKHLKVD